MQIVEHWHKSASHRFQIGKQITEHLPKRDNKPQDIHTTKLIPIEPVRSSRPEGETKIPDPATTKPGKRSLSNGGKSGGHALTYHGTDN